MSLFKDFKEFAVKGNFVDLAVGVILGAASGKVVSSLVDRLLMPPIGLLLGKVNFSELKLVLQPAQLAPDGKEIAKEVSLGYGAVLQAFIDFFIVTFVVFLVVRLYNKFRAQAPAPGPTAQEQLLMEIRDAIKEQKPTATATATKG